ncbi:MAG: hypothetical protein ABIV21_03020 [Pyrinomonadaceae bacterium]
MSGVCFRILIYSLLLLTASSFCFSQSADNQSSPFGRPDEEKSRRSLAITESLEKMRIDKEKKDYDVMIDRGEQVLSLSKRIEVAFEANGRLTDREMAGLAAAEKLTKQVRERLGGDDDGINENEGTLARPVAQANAVKAFREAAINLSEELKKTNRFTISAVAIQSSNNVLRYARLLRIAK